MPFRVLAGSDMQLSSSRAGVLTVCDEAVDWAIVQQKSGWATKAGNREPR